MIESTRYRWVSFLLIALVGCAADLATKHWIFERLGPPGGPTWWLVDGWFGFQTSLNEGALFGLGQGQVVIFAGLSTLAAILIPFWLFVRGGARDGWLTFALSWIMAGILGNLYDRLGLWWSESFALYPRYAVRDWILFQVGDWRWPNFNFADSYLVCGAGLILLHAYYLGPQNSFDKPPASS